MKKMTAYSRKRLGQPAHYNGAQWINTIGNCRPYTDEPVPGSWLNGTDNIATSVLVDVRMSFERIKNGCAAPTDGRDHDVLAHAVGVAMLRAIDIAGAHRDTNPLLPILDDATDAMRRLRARHDQQTRWGFDGQALTQMADALDVYQTILTASSPAQMAQATQQRINMLKALNDAH